MMGVDCIYLNIENQERQSTQEKEKNDERAKKVPRPLWNKVSIEVSEWSECQVSYVSS